VWFMKSDDKNKSRIYSWTSHILESLVAECGDVSHCINILPVALPRLSEQASTLPRDKK
jgi:hypothetical protein